MTDPPDDDAQIAKLAAWFDTHGRQLTYHQRPDGRWLAFYPKYGQSIASAPNEEGHTQLAAALAAKAALTRQAAT